MITVLTCAEGTRATKKWHADGKIDGYDAGWQFDHTAVPVGSLADLSRVLTVIEGDPRKMVIRGRFKVPGVTQRLKVLCDDLPLHWMCVDIDGYTPPAGIDPVLSPVQAIYAFIEDHLPVEFDGAGFHWQLSSSAGHPDNRSKLKAHVWFWMTEARDSVTMTAWANSVGTAIDRTVYRVVQPHYTALPVFEAGVVDPVGVRSGLVAGPDLALVVTPEMLADVRQEREDGGNLLDPRGKSGVVGAFCRAFTIEQVLSRWLGNVFVFEQGSNRRLTWLAGGGAVGGAFITDDRMHLVNTHNTSPVGESPLNLFDMVRVYCYGQHDVGADPLALVEMGTRPSYRMTCQALGALPEVLVAGSIPLPPQTPQTPAAPLAVAAGAVPAAAGGGFLGVPAQMRFFAGCVYIKALHRILMPDGSLLDQQRFNAMLGGHTFAMDGANERTTRAPWEAFLDSQAITHPRVDGTVFRPELPAQAIVRVEGLQCVNTYIPILTRRLAGDVGPFLFFLSKLLPDERDRRILLSYMAAMLQHVGYKFQWWPVLQGTEGNGKSALIRIMTHCIGDRYTHIPNVGEMAKNGVKFNSWLSGKLFIGIEEIYVQHRREFLDEFKPIVTNDRTQIERKGVDQTMEDNRANGMMCTNHLDGVPITVDTRRYAIFYTAQQTKADKLRDGMTDAYFADLYDWFKGRGAYVGLGVDGGYAIVNEYLHGYAVDHEFNPANGCQTAPATSSSAAAIHAGLGAIEQDILEAIEQGQAGFAGGWVSSSAVDKLLVETRRNIPRNGRRKILQSLGYDWHPGLQDGRSIAASIVDGKGRPSLFVKKGGPLAALVGPAVICAAYIKAQQG